MRRKSERCTRSNSSSVAVERSSRRSTRRGRKSPSSRSSDSERNNEEKVSKKEIDSDNKKQRDSSLDRDSEEETNKRRTRTPKVRRTSESPAKRKRGGGGGCGSGGTRSERINTIVEENGYEIEMENKLEEMVSLVDDGGVTQKKLKLTSPEKEDTIIPKSKDDRRSSDVRSSSEKEERRRHRDERRASESRSSASSRIESNEDKSFKEDLERKDEKTPETDRVVDQVLDLSEKNTDIERPISEGNSTVEVNGEKQSKNDDKISEKIELQKVESNESTNETGSSHNVTESIVNVSIERPREKRSRFDERPKVIESSEKAEEKENERSTKPENEDNNKEVKKIEKPQRKRKWLTRKYSKPQVLAISTDSLRNLISDVQPVPLSDIKLESSPEPEEIKISVPKEEEKRITEKSRIRKKHSRERESKREDKTSTITSSSKVSIVSEDDSKSLQRPPSPPKNESSNILYITNLVRPFTLLQLKGLLVRTGKIVENGFWIDRIKSKCYVNFETEDQAIETRHALHGVRWPTSNPKCLNVDFGSEAAMEKAIESTLEEAPRIGMDNTRDNRIIGTGWDKDRNDFEEKKEVQVSRPVREWDVGKKEVLERERELERNRERDRERERERERRRYSPERERDVRDRRRSSTSASPARKFKEKENDPPLRLLDDLFRKTKMTPCIYWLPLTPEQIIEKEEARRKRMEEHEELRKEREREREREKQRERRKERSSDRDRDRKKSRSRERRRY